MSLLSDRLNTLNAWNSSTQGEAQQTAQNTVQQTDTQQAPVRQGQTIYDMVKEYGKPYDYEQEMRQAERSRKMGMLTDFIKSATDFGSALAGRRIFDSGVSATKQASDRMDKIRDIQRQGAINYQNALLNARLKDAEIARNEAQRKAQMDLQREQMNESSRRWNEQMAYTKDRDKANDTWRMYQLNNQNEQAEKSRRFQAGESEKSRNFQKEMYDQKQTNTLTKGNDYVEFVGANGRKTILSKAASNAFVPVLFKRMQELVKERPGASPIEDIKLQFGESGTTADKMRMEVQKRLPDFPELQQWVEQMEVLNRMYPNSTQEEWDKRLKQSPYSVSQQARSEYASQANDFMSRMGQVGSESMPVGEIDYFDPSTGKIISVKPRYNVQYPYRAEE